MIRDPIIFIKHIIESINNIEEFCKGLTKTEFRKSKLRQNAIVRELEIIGEAVKNLPEGFIKKYPEVAWKEISGTRDIFIHQYFGVDIDIVWDIVKKDIPVLKKQIKKILREEEKV